MNKPVKEKAKQKAKTSSSKDIIEHLDGFFNKIKDYAFFGTLLLTIIFGLLLFDVKISTGGDDATYILRAKEFIDGKAFPTFQGAMYPIFLSPFVYIFGPDVIVLKITSLLFITGHFIFFYLLFRNRVSPTFTVLGLVFVSVNSYILYFGSQTYSEAMYMFLQILLLYLFILMFEKLEKMKASQFTAEDLQEKPFVQRYMKNLRDHLGLWRHWLILGFVLFLITNTRNIGLAAMISIAFVLIINKRLHAFLFISLSYLLFAVPFKIYKTVVWNVTQSSVSDQLNLILLKNVYNPSRGTEDFNGMIIRFGMNSKIYFSKWLNEIFGFRTPAITNYSVFDTLSFYALFFIALYFAFRKNKFMTSIGIYMGTAIAISFVSLGANWGQMRMIVIYIPLIIIFLSWGLYQISKLDTKEILNSLALLILGFSVIAILFKLMTGAFRSDVNMGFFTYALFYLMFIGIGIYFFYGLLRLFTSGKPVYLFNSVKNVIQLFIIFFVLFSTLSSFTISTDKIKDNWKILKKNIKGEDMYKGYTPDWIHFAEMSKYVAENPETKDAVVASRKHTMSYIFSDGKEFFPVYKFPMIHVDTLFNNLERKNLEYCIIENSELHSKMPQQISFLMKRYTVDAFVGSGGKTYAIFNFNNPLRNEYYKQLDKYNVEYTKDLKSFRKTMNVDDRNTYATVTDSLVTYFYKNNVEYVIRASLRMNPRQKTNRILNQIYRILYFSEQKYPGLYKYRHMIGNPENEPAILYKVNYDTIPGMILDLEKRKFSKQ